MRHATIEHTTSEFCPQTSALIARARVLNYETRAFKGGYLSVRGTHADVVSRVVERESLRLTSRGGLTTRKTPGYGTPPNRQVLYC